MPKLDSIKAFTVEVRLQHSLNEADAVLAKLKTFSDLSAAVALARAGDGEGFDRLVQMASADSSFPDVQRTAKATIDSIIADMTFTPRYGPLGAGCNDGETYPRPLKSVAAYEALLSSKSVNDRTQGAYCLGRAGDLLKAGQTENSIRGSMDFLFNTMTLDSDLMVRRAAFQSFASVGGSIYPNESILSQVNLYDNPNNVKWWKENRQRFIPLPNGEQ